MYPMLSFQGAQHGPSTWCAHQASRCCWSPGLEVIVRCHWCALGAARGAPVEASDEICTGGVIGSRAPSWDPKPGSLHHFCQCFHLLSGIYPLITWKELLFCLWACCSQPCHQRLRDSRTVVIITNDNVDLCNCFRAITVQTFIWSQEKEMSSSAC